MSPLNFDNDQAQGLRQTYIVTSKDTNDFAVAVQLAEDPLLHVLDIHTG